MDTTPNGLEERIAERCLQLLRIPSVTGNEAEIADHLEAWASGLPGVTPDDVIRVGNALVVGTPDNHRPCIALIGHTDTVPPCEGERPPRQEGDRLIGLGASDMKGSLAVMQVLCESLPLDLLPFSVILVLYDKEEGNYASNGLQPLLDRLELLGDIDLAVVMEPTDNTVQLGAVGSVQARLTYRGKAAHSARPWHGDNAIHKAAEMLTDLYTRPVRDVHVDGLLYREVLNATLAQGGHSRNSIPDTFEVNVNYRFAPTTPLREATKKAVDEIETIAHGADIDVYDVAPPATPPRDNPIFDHLRQHANVEIQPKQAWTDVARLCQFGIDGVNFGPGFTAQAHQKGEFASLKELVRAYTILEKVLKTPLAAVR